MFADRFITVFHPATGLRFALGIPFIFLSVTTAFLSISGGLAVIATVMFIGTYLLTKYVISLTRALLCHGSRSNPRFSSFPSRLPINNQNLKKDKDEKKEKDVDDSEDEDKKIKKLKKRKPSKKLNRKLSDEEIAQLVDIPKDTGVLIVFEGLLCTPRKSHEAERSADY